MIIYNNIIYFYIIFIYITLMKQLIQYNHKKSKKNFGFFFFKLSIIKFINYIYININILNSY